MNALLFPKVGYSFDDYKYSAWVENCILSLIKGRIFYKGPLVAVTKEVVYIISPVSLLIQNVR